MTTNWNYPTSVWLGENRIEDLSQACNNLNISNPLFVTDKDLINLDMVKNIILELKKNFNNLSIFSNFSGNPFGENVEEGVLEFKKNKCDGVIAFGGESKSPMKSLRECTLQLSPTARTPQPRPIANAAVIITTASLAETAW